MNSVALERIRTNDPVIADAIRLKFLSSGHPLYLYGMTDLGRKETGCVWKVSRAQLQFWPPPERHFADRTGYFRRPRFAAYHQTFKNHPLFVNTHFGVVYFDAVVTKRVTGRWRWRSPGHYFLRFVDSPAVDQ